MNTVEALALVLNGRVGEADDAPMHVACYLSFVLLLLTVERRLL